MGIPGARPPWVLCLPSSRKQPSVLAPGSNDRTWASIPAGCVNEKVLKHQTTETRVSERPEENGPRKTEDERGGAANRHRAGDERGDERGAGHHSAGGVAIQGAGAAGRQDGSGLRLAEAREAQAATRDATDGHEHEEKNENETNRAGASSGGDNENHDDRLNVHHTPLWRELWSRSEECRENAMGDPLG